MAVRMTAGKNEWDPGYRSAPEKPKWDQPGWRIEKEFKPRVLIGNWYEDRLQVSGKASWVRVEWVVDVYCVCVGGGTSTKTHC